MTPDASLPLLPHRGRWIGAAGDETEGVRREARFGEAEIPRVAPWDPAPGSLRSPSPPRWGRSVPALFEPRSGVTS